MKRIKSIFEQIKKKSLFTKILLSTGGFALVSLTLFYFNQELLINSLFAKTVNKNFASNLINRLPDGLHVVLCGAGSPMPDPKRSGPCTAVIAGKQMYIVDSGSGSSRNLTLFRLPPGLAQGVLLTHFHSDHIDGLGELLLNFWGNFSGRSRTTPTPVYGPPGVEEIVAGFNLAYKQDVKYRWQHHNKKTMNPIGSGAKAMVFEAPQPGELKLILEKDGLKISAIAVEHPPIDPAVAYRFDYKGRSLVISGDTVKSANLEKMSQGIDLLIHEALNKKMMGQIAIAANNNNNPRTMKLIHDTFDYHTEPTEAAEIAKDAKVGHLLFHHIVPPLPFGIQEKVWAKGVSDIFADYTIGQDGTQVSLPAESKEIRVGEVEKLLPF